MSVLQDRTPACGTHPEARSLRVSMECGAAAEAWRELARRRMKQVVLARSLAVGALDLVGR
jgi:hypothetical protein